MNYTKKINIIFCCNDKHVEFVINLFFSDYLIEKWFKLIKHIFYKYDLINKTITFLV